jgi:hypothetical protein
MKEIYRKRGRVVRMESGYLVDSAESGMAIEEPNAFSCLPFEAPPLPPLDADAVRRTAAAIEGAVSAPVRLERLLVSEGVAEHELGEQRWSDRSARLHLSLTCNGLRALIDLGGETLGDLSLGDVWSVSRALAGAGEERVAPSTMRLAPNVAAAMVVNLPEADLPGVRLHQWPRRAAWDGRGRPMERVVLGEPETWPNWFRPSYRSLPVRKPFDLRLECASTAVDSQAPRAIALLAPPEGLTVRVLCVDGRDVYPATITVGSILAAASQWTWYPYGAGAWGSETECRMQKSAT